MAEIKKAHDKPPTLKDWKMSVAHEKDSVKYNVRHKKGHAQREQEARKRLDILMKNKPAK